jgi:hypothetical protein
MRKEVYINGLHRSGTNYLGTLLNNNFSDIVGLNTPHNFGNEWKHSFIPSDKINGDVPVFIIYKNIYTWLESVIHRKIDDGWHIVVSTMTKPEYIRLENFITPENDFEFNYRNNKFTLSFLVNCYKQYFENWIFNSNPKLKDSIVLIKYEELLSDENRISVLERISEKLQWDKPKEWVNPKKGAISLSKEYDDERELYYLTESPKFLTEEQIILIDKIITEEFKNKLDTFKI